MSVFQKLLATDIPVETASTVPLTINKVSYDNNLIDYSVTGQSSQNYITIDGTQYKIPSGYTVLDYINNNNAAYLDLGMNIGTSDKITFDIMWNTGKASPFFGAYNSGGSFSTNSFVGTYYQNAAQACFYANNGVSIGYFTKPIGTRVVLKWNGINARPTLDGTELSGGTLPFQDFTPSVNAFFFTRNQGGTAGTIDDITLYKLLVYNSDDTPKAFFIPMKRNSDSVAGVYDLIRNVFITSANSSAFVAGNEGVSPDRPVDVKSCGDKTANLFDGHIIDEYTIATATGQKIYQTSRSINIFGWLEAGTYTVCTTVPNIIGNYIHLYSSEGDDSTFSDWVRAISLSAQQQSGIFYYKTFTLDDKYYVRNVNLIEEANIGNYMLVKGDIIPTSYIPYGYQIPTVVGSNCGCVDLGSLTWSYNASKTTFRTSSLVGSIAEPDNSSRTANAYANGYTVSDYNTTYTQQIDKTLTVIWSSSAAHGQVWLQNHNYTDADTFKQAMSGVYLYYQRLTDTSFEQPVITNIYLDQPLRKIGNFNDIMIY